MRAKRSNSSHDLFVASRYISMHQCGLPGVAKASHEVIEYEIHAGETEIPVWIYSANRLQDATGKCCVH